MLDREERTELLALARRSIECCLARVGLPEFHPGSPGLRARSGAFVSLHNGRSLRGCIGMIFADCELYKVVEECAAGLQDAIESMREGLVLYDKDDRVVVFNPLYELQ